MYPSYSPCSLQPENVTCNNTLSSVYLQLNKTEKNEVETVLIGTLRKGDSYGNENITPKHKFTLFVT